MKVFVTGGTGFVGSNLIKRLVAEGNFVFALARSGASAEQVQTMGASPVRGDLETIASWKDQLRGFDAVIHCAAPVEFWGPWERFERDIVLATKKLMEASSEAGVGKFIHLSSESVLQDALALDGIDESYPYPDRPNSYYGIAKKEAELGLLQASTGMSIIILRPPFIWGSGSKSLDDVAKLAKSGGFLWASKGRALFEAIHVDNLVEAIIAAIKSGRGKALYFVTDDDPVTTREFFSGVFKAKGLPIPTMSLPNSAIKWAAMSIEKIWRLVGIRGKPPLTKFEWAFIGMPRRYNITKIKRELGYVPKIGRREGLKQLSQ